jgi:hypothetical protein
VIVPISPSTSRVSNSSFKKKGKKMRLRNIFLSLPRLVMVGAALSVSAAAGGLDAAAVPEGAASSTVVATIEPVVSVNVLMVKFVDQAADSIWTAAVHPPQRTCEWEQIEYRATQLAMTGTLLKIGGTGPMDMHWKASPAWTPFADKMTALALAAAKAAKEKNTTAIKKIGDELIVNCEACHRAFKPEIPTQNISTHMSHAVPLADGLPPNCRAK